MNPLIESYLNQIEECTTDDELYDLSDEWFEDYDNLTAGQKEILFAATKEKIERLSN